MPALRSHSKRLLEEMSGGEPGPVSIEAKKAKTSVLVPEKRDGLAAVYEEEEDGGVSVLGGEGGEDAGLTVLSAGEEEDGEFVGDLESPGEVEDEDEDEGGVDLEEDEDEDEGGVDLEEDDMQELLGEEGRTSLESDVAGLGDGRGDEDSAWEDEDEEEEEKEEELVQPRRTTRAAAKRPVARRSRRTVRSRRSGQSIYDVASYEQLDLGPSDLPDWFVHGTSAEDKAAGIESAEGYWTKYFEKVKSQAAQWTYQHCDEWCPYTRRVLAVLQNPHWTAKKLADFVLAGKSDYCKFLDGLPRQPTKEQIKAIPAPTEKQLRQTGLYTSLVENRRKQYRYTGSGIAKGGIAKRVRQYELLKRMVNEGRKAQPSLEVLNHVNLLLQKDSKAFWRLRASYTHAVATPALVIIAEAAIIDFERTMSDMVPSAYHSHWSTVQSPELVQASRERYPDNKDASIDFEPLNKASPYKQGVQVGMYAHRCRIFEEGNLQCSCCLKMLTGRPEFYSKTGRLSWEIGLFHEGVTTVCTACVSVWKPDQAESMTAEEFVQHRRAVRVKQAERALDGTQKAEGCCVCSRVLYKVPHGYVACKISGYGGKDYCTPCYSEWWTLCKANTNPDISAFVEHRIAVLAGENTIKQGRPRLAPDSDECCICEAPMWPGRVCYLQGYEGQRCCSRCEKSVATNKRAGRTSATDNRALIDSRKAQRRIEVEREEAKEAQKAREAAFETLLCCNCSQELPDRGMRCKYDHEHQSARVCKRCYHTLWDARKREAAPETLLCCNCSQELPDRGLQCKYDHEHQSARVCKRCYHTLYNAKNKGKGPRKKR